MLIPRPGEKRDESVKLFSRFFKKIIQTHRIQFPAANTGINEVAIIKLPARVLVPAQVQAMLPEQVLVTAPGLVPVMVLGLVPGMVLGLVLGMALGLVLGMVLGLVPETVLFVEQAEV